ncbi:MAG: sodium:calcium antiporter [Caldimicrobium sp.]|nr:sodium:calcium antiporter [Caldimicrobium sp.]MCX7873777.1 sodium:calcium antiporter [Caldimicrobium sp.]MDW8095006.1 sodium:calcium antiporter [Caldimicrobium sp.]
MILLEAVLALSIILICAEIFTNGVEVFGENLSLSQAVVGSILAAIGTALPETIIPMVAILLYKGETGAHIGVGAILGAPFMLVTAGLFLVGLGVIITYLQGKRPLQVYLEPHTFIRDFSFFLLSYSLAIFIPLLFPNSSVVNYVLAIILLLNYTVYLYLTFRSESLEVEAYKDLYLEKPFKWLKIELSKKHTIVLALLQAFLAILIMIKGAHLFVHALEVLSKKLGLSPLLFALLVAPLATELPEKFNSLLWTLRGKDVLALGNMTGAMVFQSTFPVSVGLLFTDWQIKGLALISALMTLSLGFVYIIFLIFLKKLPPNLLLLSGLTYFLYILLVLLYS